MKTLRFKTNINCNNCVMAVTPHLNALDDVEEWSVDIDSEEKVLSVATEGGAEEISEAVAAAGYSSEPIDGKP